MLRSKKLKPVVKLAGHREQKSAKKLGQSKASLQQLQNKLQTLINHRDNYATNLQQKASTGMKAAEYARSQSFLAQIEDAIHQQKQLINASRMVVDDNKANWRTAKVKQQAIEKVESRLKKDEDQIREKQGQKEQDDLTNTRFFNNKSSL